MNKPNAPKSPHPAPAPVPAPRPARRFFLLAAVATAAGSIAGTGLGIMSARRGAEARNEEHGAEQTAMAGSPRWGLLVDSERCAADCSACVDACEHAHGLDLLDQPDGLPDERWAWQRPRWIRKVRVRDERTGRVSHLPLMCQHCAEPPCVKVCPTGASLRRADGIVIVDRHLCIGCRYCMLACPYGARSFVHHTPARRLSTVPRGRGTVESCTLCVERRDRREPSTACADACTESGHGALLFGDLNDPNSLIARRLASKPSRALRAELALDPAVRYSGR